MHLTRPPALGSRIRYCAKGMEWIRVEITASCGRGLMKSWRSSFESYMRESRISLDLNGLTHSPHPSIHPFTHALTHDYAVFFSLQESKGHLDSKDPASVAAFLRAQADRLDKTEASVGLALRRQDTLLIDQIFQY